MSICNLSLIKRCLVYDKLCFKTIIEAVRKRNYCITAEALLGRHNILCLIGGEKKII